MSISVIIITKNESKMLPRCFKTLKWVDEIVLVDAQSDDNTLEIAKKNKAKIITVPSSTDYASSRNSGQKAASGDWLLYVDADERITAKLKKEIISVINSPLPAPPKLSGEGRSIINSYKIPRQNIMLGRWLKHGGFWPDYVHRLFYKQALVKWTGTLHESPTVKGGVGLLANPIKHYTARSIKGALAKSARWITIEAQLLKQANVANVHWWKPIKAFVKQFLQVFVIKQGWKDGLRGFILAYIQAFHQMAVLVRLWELQKEQ